MLKARLIPCLDVKDGRVVKGVNFVDLRDAGDPVACAIAYDAAGADELCFLDITASHENRSTLLDVVQRTAEACFMPLTVGGGVRKTEDIRNLLLAGADKVAINTAAVQRPRLRQGGCREIRQPMHRRGDRRQKGPRSLAALGNIHPRRPARDRHRRGRLCSRVVALGAGEILLTSMDRDGAKIGFDLALTSAVAGAVGVPVIASGGVGNLDHLVDGVRVGRATRCSRPRSSISANTPSGRLNNIWRGLAWRCGWTDAKSLTLGRQSPQ